MNGPKYTRSVKTPSLRLSRRRVAIACVSLATAGAMLIAYQPSADPETTEVKTVAVAAPVVDDLPQHRDPPPPPPPPPPKPKPVARPRPRPRPRAAPVANIDVYRGLGAWVDIYDETLDVSAAVDEMSRRGVKVLYLETNNWRSRGDGTGPCAAGPDVDILFPDIVTNYLDRAHAKGIRVVGWYLPGFGNVERDIKRSLAAINFSTPSGNRFDGFAADIETRGEFGCQGVTGDDVRQRFNAGIIEYSNRLRASVGGDKVLGAIVVDAKNNERAPARWEGFPWGEIAKNYQVVMPMAYWTAAPDNAGCPGADLDTASYMKQVVEKTQALMGTSRPLAPIGGIADCITAAETAGYVAAMKAVGAIGASLYDYRTIQDNPEREVLWAELARFTQ
jgi:hypothetical protein